MQAKGSWSSLTDQLIKPLCLSCLSWALGNISHVRFQLWVKYRFGNFLTRLSMVLLTPSPAYLTNINKLTFRKTL